MEVTGFSLWAMVQIVGLVITGIGLIATVVMLGDWIDRTRPRRSKKTQDAVRELHRRMSGIERQLKRLLKDEKDTP